MTAPPLVPNHSRRPRHSATFHTQGGPEHCHRCEGERREREVGGQKQPAHLKNGLLLGGPIKFYMHDMHSS